MDDLKKKEKEQTAAIAKLVSENAHHEQSGYSQPYRCANCNERVNYTFILPFIKAKTLCPDCYWKSEDEE